MASDPYAWYDALRDREPVHFHARAGMWFLTRHDDCARVLRERDFSAALGQHLRRRADPLPPSMLNADASDHARLRAPAAKVFAARSVERWRASVRALVDRVLDDVAGRAEFDVASEFAHPLTLRLLAEILDVPSEQRERFGRWLDEASINLDPLAEDEVLAGAVEAARRLQHAFSEQLDGSKGRSDFGVLDLLHGACADAKLSRDEFLSMVNLIVIGGYEPTANLIANAVLALLRHPDQLLRLREDESVLAAAVDELLRYDTPVQVAARVTREDVVIGGTAIQRGQPLVVFLGAANHDPAVFEEPARLDLERRPNPHLTFGAGEHFCLGAPLARLVCQEALRGLLGRFGELELAAPVEWRRSVVPRGVEALQVRVA
jgi:pimeloyl-[acyl-carrier protein] synthase